ncbi:nucleoside/nucleotide kinase family protein [Chromohalobacter sp. HP20-39]|uniref:nucleoside/nucleotide kinase family protein n=1 Tax=Chromohalobacter sp. HP20-39 TaxID=3079306 RepID=UPI00294B382A|nr:nucleoside/nucleotide kinase family protein [Chromohalobacter sp. HP20-39]MDV6319679.1 nucleoside/nucleotide kinase family protein [Chromohalobacter sp. HP20-39]
MIPKIHDLAVRLIEASTDRPRFIVALAGPPAAGKSFLSEWLCRELNHRQPGIASIVPMDGYHFDNAVLEPQGLVPVKGAPETFDIDGFQQDLTRIRRADLPVAVPVFDRPLDLARAGGRLIGLEHRLIIVEGNYLLLDRSPWRELHPLFDMTLFLEVPDDVLEARLIQRWGEMGMDPDGALDRARNKDMLNARLIKTASVAADLYWAASD